MPIVLQMKPMYECTYVVCTSVLRGEAVRRRGVDKNIRNEFLPRPPSVVTREEGINSGDVITLITPYISFISQDGGEEDCSWFLPLTLDFHFTSRHLQSLQLSRETFATLMVPQKCQLYLWQLAYSVTLCVARAFRESRWMTVDDGDDDRAAGNDSFPFLLIHTDSAYIDKYASHSVCSVVVIDTAARTLTHPSVPFVISVRSRSC